MYAGLGSHAATTVVCGPSHTSEQTERGFDVAYKNAESILPPELLKQVQIYTQGELIYIPTVSEKTGWGEKNGTRRRYEERNRQLRVLYDAGLSYEEIAAKFYLTKDRIRKILHAESCAEQTKNHQ